MNQRPITFLLFPFVIGIFVADQIAFSFSGILIAFITLLFIGLSILFVKKRTNYLLSILILILLFAGFVRFQIVEESFENQSVHHFLGEPIRAELIGLLNSEPEVLHNGIRASVFVDSLVVQNNKYSATGNILLRWKKDLPFQRAY